MPKKDKEKITDKLKELVKEGKYFYDENKNIIHITIGVGTAVYIYKTKKNMTAEEAIDYATSLHKGFELVVDKDQIKEVVKLYSDHNKLLAAAQQELRETFDHPKDFQQKQPSGNTQTREPSSSSTSSNQPKKTYKDEIEELQKNKEVYEHNLRKTNEKLKKDPTNTNLKNDIDYWRSKLNKNKEIQDNLIKNRLESLKDGLNSYQKTYEDAKANLDANPNDQEAQKEVRIWEKLLSDHKKKVDDFQDYINKLNAPRFNFNSWIDTVLNSLDSYWQDRDPEWLEQFKNFWKQKNKNYDIKFEDNKLHIITPAHQGAKTATEQGEAIANVDKQTYDVKKLSGSQLANVLNDIPKVSFLLSNILIFEGEKLSLGDKGTHTVKKGDTVSQIAKKYGLSTKELVILNPYLAKKDRIKFKQDSVLVKVDKSKIEDDDSNITVSVSSVSTAEAAKSMTFLITVSRPLKEEEYVVVSVNGTYIRFEKDKQSEEYTYTWEDDKIPEEDTEFKITPTIIAHSDGLNVKTESGTGTIIDDDKDPDDDDPENPPIPRDPLAIDLNRDGTRTLKLNGALNFDIDGNGFKEATGWISPEDAFLAYDRNENGVIDDGTELFGDKTVTNTAFGYTSKAAENGFEALKAFDSNSDNVIDEKDEKFDKLLLWQDKNSNAVTDEGELKTLREHNIKSIDLNYQNINSTNNGNFIRQTSKVTFNDGTTTTADDIWFSVDLKDTIQPDIAISNDIRALPEVHGFGNLYNLRSAMSKDSKLAGMIKEYMSLSSDVKQDKLDEVLFRWAQVEDIDKTSRGENIDARILGAYEKITGKPFLQFGNNPNPWASAAATIKNRVKQFKDYLYSSIELQSKYNGLLDTRYQYFNYDEKRLGYDFSKINRKLLQLYKDRKYEEVATLSDLVRKAGSYKPNLLDSFNASLTKLANGDKYFTTISSSVPLYNANSNDPLRGTNGNDLIVGNSGDDTLSGENGDDILYGGEGDDTLYGEYGNDILEGGAGNDRLEGGYGDDAYVFGRGDGVDTIYDVYGNDTIKFKEGISLKDLIVKRADKDIRNLEISIKGTEDKITINNVYWGGAVYDGGMIENFEFADGTKLSLHEFETQTIFKGTDANDTIIGASANDEIHGGAGDDLIGSNGGDDILYGEAGADTLNGDDGNDTIYGGEGNDKLNGGNGNDILYGGEGDDTLYGEYGNDILEGGAGNDRLEGGYGDDAYVFGRGDGVDTIYDVYGNDTIKFKEGITKENLTFMFNGNNLSIRYGEGDSITVNNYTDNAAYQIEKIELEGGNFITNSQINKIIQDINAYAKDNGITGISHDTIRNNQDMMNLVMSGWNS